MRRNKISESTSERRSAIKWNRSNSVSRLTDMQYQRLQFVHKDIIVRLFTQGGKYPLRKYNSTYVRDCWPEYRVGKCNPKGCQNWSISYAKLRE